MGAANQTSFDASKESRSAINRFKEKAAGPEFKLLGIHFDIGLTMVTTFSFTKPQTQLEITNAVTHPALVYNQVYG